MICQWCHKPIEKKDIGVPCGRGFSHWPDNRHYPHGTDKLCFCGRSSTSHRVFHQPEREPCGRVIVVEGSSKICGLPASSHITRKPISSVARRRQLGERDGWICQLCKENLNDLVKYPHPLSTSIDHIVPVWKGGSDNLSNLQLAHRLCNMKKQNDDPSPRQRSSNGKSQEETR
jgi:5-methylcytosine-specific restriction endonuclease McrA